MTESDRCGRSCAGVLNAVAIVAFACLLSGCGDSQQAAPKQTGTTTPPSLLASAFAITIENNDFSHLSTPRSAQVKVLNKDNVEHTVTSDTPGLFDVRVPPRDEKVFIAPDKPGTYPYHSTDQPSMHGELVVYQSGQ